MSIRLDPRRLGTLKHLAGEAGVRPGDLVRQWVEERIDAARTGGAISGGGGAITGGVAEMIDALAKRVTALEAALGTSAREPEAASAVADTSSPSASPTAAEPAVIEAGAVDAEAAAPDATEPIEEPPAEEEIGAAPATGKRRRTAVSAAPRERVALHDEMIAVLGERGPMTASDLADAIAERGRYAPPRSGKPLSAAMISQRVSNPTYRSRFVRADGRIGLAEGT